jgi:hypothetical protein
MIVTFRRAWKPAKGSSRSMPYVPVSAASSCSSAEAWSAKAEQKASGLTQDLIKAEQKRKLRAQLLFHERLADVEARLNDRNHPLELVDGGGDRGLFGFFLRLLTGERRRSWRGAMSISFISPVSPRTGAWWMMAGMAFQLCTQ